MVMLISRISNINIKIHSIYFIFLLISLLLCLLRLIPTFILIPRLRKPTRTFSQAGIYIIIYTVIASHSFACTLVLIHILFLHQTGSNNPLGIKRNLTRTAFPSLLYAKRPISHLKYVTLK
ncbi:hypothetical protein Avbf_12015 [Armadillidium vulgare]|nr:hypothetical protein Avbf_12015 [Armadillidium vulgare]